MIADLEHIAILFGVLVSACSLITGVIGAFAWYSSKVKKEYAAERDFKHLKNDYKQLAINIEQLWRLMDNNFREHEKRLVEQHSEILRELAELKRESK